jgi:hypothetical protein
MRGHAVLEMRVKVAVCHAGSIGIEIPGHQFWRVPVPRPRSILPARPTSRSEMRIPQAEARPEEWFQQSLRNSYISVQSPQDL